MDETEDEEVILLFFTFYQKDSNHE